MAEETRTRLYDGDTFELRGYTFKVTFPRDETMGPPWKEHDGHGPVSDWTTRDKRAGERVLVADRAHRRYYDFAAATQQARTEGWGPPDGRRPGETAKQARARAVEADYTYLKDWCEDRWEWLGVVVELQDVGRKDGASLWGIESLSEPSYFTETAYELAEEIISRVEVETPDAVLSEN